MKIIVEGHLIETTQITSICDIEYGKKHFLNRAAGFIIAFKNQPILIISEKIPYDSYPSEISRIKNKYSDLQAKVEEQWKKDKGDILTFNL